MHRSVWKPSNPRAAAPAVINPVLIKFLRVIVLFFIVSSFRLVACSFSNRALETFTPFTAKADRTPQLVAYRDSVMNAFCWLKRCGARSKNWQAEANSQPGFSYRSPNLESIDLY